MSEFSVQAMHRLIKRQGDKRVSEPAAEELHHVLETFAGDVAEMAVEEAQEQNRETLRKTDIQNALRN